MTPQELRDRAVLLLIGGGSESLVEGFCVQQGMDPDQAKDVVAEAKSRITIAADYARDEQVGKAVMRLEDLYAKSMAARDIRSALQAQRELNRLLALYADSRKGEDQGEADGGGTVLRERLDLISSYLMPLELADPAYPIEEHARLAADFVRSRKEEASE
nr:hypothetical protein 11 [Flavobacteriaceae bacterium]